MAKILIVDDQADSRDSLALILQKAGHEAVSVPNGREALSHLLAEMPDAMVLDLVMPEMDGPSLLEVVRSYLRIQSLSVVVLTALTDSPMIERVQALKVNSVLVKGRSTPEDILKALEEALARHPS